MSKIFELFGYRLDQWNEAAAVNLSQARCPFMNRECDGGGNRYSSAIHLDEHSALKVKIPEKKMIQCGVCSLQLHTGEQPWIVCPRRLLSIKHGNLSSYQTNVRRKISTYSGLIEKRNYKVWSEVKIKTEIPNEEDEAKTFDYTFDYVIAGTERKRVDEVAENLEISSAIVRKTAESNGFTIASRNGVDWIDDFPTDPLIIIEVMTSSTSGGNKRDRTQIAQACEDAILNGMKHNGPSINYRQVWARMVSQLIVKSQVALAWGGKTIWLVQDVLADYISKSTALRLPDYLSETLSEVNILQAGYGSAITGHVDGPIELTETKLFSGPIAKSEGGDTAKGFIDIVKIGAPPPKKQIWKSLLHKPPLGSWTIS
ncbi:MAG: hypothetical protein LBM06_00520 [Prevotellaceae bacterium]|jgi:hypothetical protein|nr:hypothetical protein [Prevotellaceae bacterium]